MLVLKITGFCCEMLFYIYMQWSINMTPLSLLCFFVSNFFLLHNSLCVWVLSLDFSSIETINTVNESINTVCYTSLVATAMMHCSVNPPCSPGHGRLDWFTLCRPLFHPGEAGTSSYLHRAIDSIKVSTTLPFVAPSLNTYLGVLLSHSHNFHFKTLFFFFLGEAIPWCFLDNLSISRSLPFPPSTHVILRVDMGYVGSCSSVYEDDQTASNTR